MRNLTLILRSLTLLLRNLGGIGLLAGLFACGNKTPFSSGKTTGRELSSAAATRGTGGGQNVAYDLAHPEKTWDLPFVLREISGNCWMDPTHLLVIEDLHPHLYVIRLENPIVIEKDIAFRQSPFSKFDIEDVTQIGDTAYALWSHGVIYQCVNWKNKLQVREMPTFLTKDNNPEGICFDPVSRQLLVACKGESLSGEKKSTRAVYAFDIGQGRLLTDPFLVISKKELERVANDKVDLNPSAIAVHPLTHEIYLLSTKGSKCLARFDRRGQVLSVQFIDPDLLPQPEGLCFSPEGILYISSEGKGGLPKLCRFMPLAGPSR
jgi:hypothetical protein